MNPRILTGTIITAMAFMAFGLGAMAMRSVQPDTTTILDKNGQPKTVANIPPGDEIQPIELTMLAAAAPTIQQTEKLKQRFIETPGLNQVWIVYSIGNGLCVRIEWSRKAPSSISVSIFKPEEGE